MTHEGTLRHRIGAVPLLFVLLVGGAAVANPGQMQEGSGVMAGHSAGHGGMHGIGGPDLLASSDPSEGQSLPSAPTVLRLGFKQPVQLRSLQIFDSTGSRVPIAESNPAVETNTISTGLPRLLPDTYEARWRASTADGQSATGSIRFTVE